MAFIRPRLVTSPYNARIRSFLESGIVKPIGFCNQFANDRRQELRGFLGRKLHERLQILPIKDLLNPKWPIETLEYACFNNEVDVNIATTLGMLPHAQQTARFHNLRVLEIHLYFLQSETVNSVDFLKPFYTDFLGCDTLAERLERLRLSCGNSRPLECMKLAEPDFRIFEKYLKLEAFHLSAPHTLNLIPSNEALTNLVCSLPPSLTEVNIPLANNIESVSLLVGRLPRLRTFFATGAQVLDAATSSGIKLREVTLTTHFGGHATPTLTTQCDSLQTLNLRGSPMKKVEDMVHTMSSCPNLTTLDMGDFVLYPESMDDCDRFAAALVSLEKLRKLQMSSIIFGNFMDEECLLKLPQLRHLSLKFPLFLSGKSRSFRRDFNFKKFSIALLKSRLECMQFEYCLTAEELFSLLECFKSTRSSASRGVAHALASESSCQTSFDGEDGDNADFDCEDGGNADFDCEDGGNAEFDGEYGGNADFDCEDGGNADFDGEDGGNADFDCEDGGNAEFDGEDGDNADFDCEDGGNAEFDGEDGGNADLRALTEANHVDSEHDLVSTLECLSISVRSSEESTEKFDTFFVDAEFNSITNLLVCYVGAYEVKEVLFSNGKRTS